MSIPDELFDALEEVGMVKDVTKCFFLPGRWKCFLKNTEGGGAGGGRGKEEKEKEVEDSFTFEDRPQDRKGTLSSHHSTSLPPPLLLLLFLLPVLFSPSLSFFTFICLRNIFRFRRNGGGAELYSNGDHQ